MSNYEFHGNSTGSPIYGWTKGVPVEPAALEQLRNTASLPFIHHHVAAMPDVHLGIGATVGSVVPTKGAIIPAAVGVDIGCGMMAARLGIQGKDLPDSLRPIRDAIENHIPVGQASYEAKGVGYQDSWESSLQDEYLRLAARFPKIEPKAHPMWQLGTLGGGNHFIELCLDKDDNVWLMLHSGSRGVGNKIGTYFISLAKQDMKKHFISLPDSNLAYLVEGTDHFDDYVAALSWAQEYARINRECMFRGTVRAVVDALKRPLTVDQEAVNCHHNYAAQESHYGANVWVTRKGAVRARKGDLGIIPGSMGAKSFIVKGKGSAESFHSCSHGAGRVMSRTKAKESFDLEDHVRATEGVECRKDAGVLDETPKAYKDIESVMAAQSDLVEIVAELKQVLCVKG